MKEHAALVNALDSCWLCAFMPQTAELAHIIATTLIHHILDWEAHAQTTLAAFCCRLPETGKDATWSNFGTLLFWRLPAIVCHAPLPSAVRDWRPSSREGCLFDASYTTCTLCKSSSCKLPVMALHHHHNLNATTHAIINHFAHSNT